MEKKKGKTEREMPKKAEKKLVETKKDKCNDIKCPFHGKLKTRGRVFQGFVKKKLQNRLVIEFEKTLYVKKYERYLKKRTRIHARLPSCMDINVGDYVKIQECRPLSKIIHFVVIEKIRDKEGEK